MEYDDDDKVGQTFAAMVELGMPGRRLESVYGRFIGEDGRPVQKTKYTHPYSYDPFVLWKGKGDANGSVYTDRLYQWDYEKADRLGKKHMPGKRWDNAQPSQIEAFLREYLDAPDLKLVKIIEYCNVSNGYPVWRLDFYATPTGAKD